MTVETEPELDADLKAEHVQNLQRRLAEAEATVEALVTGQVDAVLDSARGDAVLLQRAQAALRESESRYRWLAAELAEAQEIAHVGSWQWDVLADEVTCSDEMHRIFGREPSRAESWAEFLENFHPDDRASVQAQLTAVLKSPQPFSFDHRIRRPNGSLRYLHGRGVVKLDEAGRVVRVLGTCHDVTRWVVAQAEIRVLNAQLEERVQRRTAQLEAANQALERDIHERQKTERALQSSRDQLSVILRGAADGITAQSPDGRLIYANDAAAQLWGYATPAELLEAAPNEVSGRVALYDEDGRPFPKDRLPGRLALALHTPHSATVRYRHRHSGSERWTYVRATPIFTGDGQAELAVSLYHDVTELKRAELEQRLLAETGSILAGSLGFVDRLASIARLMVPVLADWCAVTLVEGGQTSQVAVSHVDPDKAPLVEELQRRYPPEADEATSLFRVLRTGQAELYAHVSEAMLRAAARDEEHWQKLNAVGLRSAMIVPLVARGRMLGALTCVWADSGRQYGSADLALGEELARRAALAVDNARLYEAERQARAEAQGLNAELEQRVLERTGQLQAANTKLERSREHLRRLSSHLQTAREAEQMRIAREIHDELGQTLTALKMDVAWLRRHLDAEPDTLTDKVDSMTGLIDATVQTVRKITQELRPGILDDLGLLPALEWQLREFQQHSGLMCEFHTQLDQIDLDTHAATAVFRIFQETLTNIGRHAAARRVRVFLTEARGHLVLEVRDDGRGIAENELTKPKSFGLLGMRERVHLLGGDISLRGEPGRGTTVIARVPLRGRASPRPA